MEDKKILYLCPGFPFPADFGGSQCWLKHIKELAISKYNSKIKYIFFSLKKDIEKPDFAIDYHVIKSKCTIEPSLYNKIKRFFTFFSKWTYAMSIRKGFYKSLKPNLIVMDDFAMLPLLPHKKDYKLIYIVHNIEYDIEKDQAKLETNKILKICRYIDAIKTKFLEQDLLKKADKIVCISTSDYKEINKKYQYKTVLLPHKIDLLPEKWNGKKEKTLFFCGATWFYPNNEAIEWIVKELAPILSKDIKIKIAGKGTDELPESWKRDNIDFLGFVSKEELYNLYKTSSAFICPIVYGSGVKIKVTEALSFGMPVIATKESLEGLDYLKIKPLIDRNDLHATKNNIEELLNNHDKLQSYSNNFISQIETYQKNNDNSLEKIIEECLNE